MSGVTNSAKATLLQQITSKIRFSGPITVADYMKEVLTNSAAVRVCTCVQIIFSSCILNLSFVYCN